MDCLNIRKSADGISVGSSLNTSPTGIRDDGGAASTNASGGTGSSAPAAITGPENPETSGILESMKKRSQQREWFSVNEVDGLKSV